MHLRHGESPHSSRSLLVHVTSHETLRGLLLRQALPGLWIIQMSAARHRWQKNTPADKEGLCTYTQRQIHCSKSVYTGSGCPFRHAKLSVHLQPVLMQVVFVCGLKGPLFLLQCVIWLISFFCGENSSSCRGQRHQQRTGIKRLLCCESTMTLTGQRSICSEKCPKIA